jgi:WD40 repeat protein
MTFLKGHRQAGHPGRDGSPSAMAELDDAAHRMESDAQAGEWVTPRVLADRLVDQQLWWRVCAEAVATSSDRLLEWYDGLDRALFEALASRGEAAVHAARALAGIGAALTGVSSGDPAIQVGRALAHWSGAHALPRMPVTPSAHGLLATCAHSGLRDVLSLIDRSAGDQTRAFLALQAAMLAGLPVAERSVRQVRVLFDHRGEEQVGRTGTLRVFVLPGGPSGLYPDPRTMTFFQADRYFVDALTAAWSYATRGRTEPPCVLWSLTSVEGERQWRVEGDSLGAALAVALCESLRGWSWLRIPFLARFQVSRSRSAITGSVAADGSVGAVGGLDRKLEAAHQHRWRVVAPSANGDARRSKPDGLKLSLVGNVRQARRKAKRWLATRIIAGVGTLLLAATGSLVVDRLVQLDAESNAAEQNRQREQRRSTAAKLLMTAESLRESQPVTALQLGIAAVAVDDGPVTKASLLTALTVREESTVLTTVGGVQTAALGNGLAMVGGSAGVTLWNVKEPARPEVVASAKGASVVTEVGADGFVLAGMADGTIQLWDPSNAYQQVNAEILARPRAVVQAATFFSGGRSGVIGWRDGTATIWTIVDGRVTVQKVVRLAPTLRWLAVGPDNHTLYAGTSQGTVVWELIDRYRPTQLHGPDPRMDYRAMAPGKRERDDIALALVGERAVMLDFEKRLNPKEKNELAIKDRKNPVRSIAMAADGRTGVIGGADGTAQAWRFVPVIGGRDYRPRALLDGHTDEIVATAVSPDGSTALTVGRDDKAILWDLSHQDVALAPIAEAGDEVVAVAGTPKAGSAFTLNAAGAAVVWGITNLSRPRRLGNINGRSRAPVGTFALSADGTMAFVGGKKSAPVLWDVSDPSRLRPFAPVKDRNRSVHAAAFSPDRGTLAISGDVEVALWDISIPDRPARLGGIPTHGHTTSVAIGRTSPEHTYLLTGDGGVAVLWEMSDRAQPRLVGTLPGSGRLTTMAFDPASDTLLIGRATKLSAEMWDIRDPAQPYLLPALGDHNDPVQAVAFSANGLLALTAGADGVVNVWNLIDRSRPQRLTRLTGHVGAVRSAAILGDGGTALSGSSDGEALLWDITALANIAANPVDRACQEAGGGLSARDWQRYAPELPYTDICPA